MKKYLTITLLACSTSAMAEWVEYSVRSNGDVHYYDNARVEIDGSSINVWTRVRYKTSVMAASSYQNLLKIDCAESTETILQDTFYTDREWTKPAMATNTNAKPARPVRENSPTADLLTLLCTS